MRGHRLPPARAYDQISTATEPLGRGGLIGCTRRVAPPGQTTLRGDVRLNAARALCHARHRGASTSTMAHSTQAAHSHMQDHEGHVLAVESDLEYWRTKRLEPRVLQLHRRGVVTLYDMLHAASHPPAAPAPAGESQHDTEGRIRALEDGLDDYIRSIGLVFIDPADHPFVIEDTRKERGDYDDF